MYKIRPEHVISSLNSTYFCEICGQIFSLVGRLGAKLHVLFYHRKWLRRKNEGD